MADEDEDKDDPPGGNALERFGWTNASDVTFEDEDGTVLGRGGPIPPHVQELLDRHAEKVKEQNAVKAQDARMKRPKVKLHIHRK